MKKYKTLREEIEKEIKSLKLQAENLIKIEEYNEKINSIDSVIFQQSNKIALETFPDLSSIIYTERENTRSNLKKVKEEINQSKEIVQKKLANQKTTDLKIDNFIPEFENENLIKQQIAENEKENKNLDQTFQRISNEKKDIINKAQEVNDAEFQQIEILNEVQGNINHIENKLTNLKFWIKLKKKKTVMIFWGLIFVFLGLIACLIALFLI